MTPRRWRVIPTAPATSDIRDVLRWTLATFGTQQARRYQNLITSALLELENGPSSVRLRRQSNLGDDIWTMRLASPGNPASHVLICRCRQDSAIVQVLRILHSAMDPTLHIAADDPG
jgi:plasmid stabilization system protein ParE